MLSIVRRTGKRFSSTKATAKASYQLPPDKLRALTSIYHQAGSFITPENLSARIDQAFALDHSETFHSNFIDNGDLKSIRTSQRQRPKVREWEKDINSAVLNGTFSDSITRREARVIETLYGVDSSDNMHRLPGLEVLEESVITEDEVRTDKEVSERTGSVSDAYEEQEMLSKQAGSPGSIRS